VIHAVRGLGELSIFLPTQAEVERRRVAFQLAHPRALLGDERVELSRARRRIAGTTKQHELRQRLGAE